MNQPGLSRRAALRSIGGALAVGALANTAWDVRCAAKPEPAAKRLIDTHLHLVNPRLPGVPDGTAPDKKTELAPFDVVRQPDGAAQLARVIQDEMLAAGFGHALCMPRRELSDADPLGIRETLALAARVRGPKLHAIGMADPERFDPDHLARVEEELKQGKVKAFKVYLGYLHHGPYSPGYRPYYKLAAKYQVPVILHTGDTFSAIAKVKYAHPLRLDEIAVDFPETHFVLAHFGNPWITDAAQVVYKNKNVWADLSGILIGDGPAFAAMKKDGVLNRTVKRLKAGIEYSEAPERFLFGSDWPLASLADYRDFVEQLFPKDLHQAVFHDNAKALFKL